MSSESNHDSHQPQAGSTIVPVELGGRTYPIVIGSGLLRELGLLLRSRFSSDRLTLITDENVGPLHAGAAVASAREAGFDVEVLTVPAGDATKCLDQAGVLWDSLAGRRHSRFEPIVALGGGVVGDLAGFVAATWLRGVPFVQCPTTTEADIDAAVGGKTAINHRSGKNLIGAFHQPSIVCIDTRCLATLSDRDFRAGLAESVKHAVIRDPGFLDWQTSRAAEILAQDELTLVELIRRNCANKAAVVAADERETADSPEGRVALNFGHTFGHAIEAQSEYALRHGEAVALGMVAELELAVSEIGFPSPDRGRVERLLNRLGLPTRSPIPLEIPELLARLEVDKKVRNQRVRFAIPRRLGEMQWLVAPSVESVNRALRRVID